MIWHGDAIKQKLRVAATARVEAATAHLQASARENIGVQGPPRSTAGNFPHRDKGRLQASVQATQGETETQVFGDVGSSLPYAGYLEHGTDRMEPRPWLARTLQEQRDVIAQTLGVK